MTKELLNRVKNGEIVFQADKFTFFEMGVGADSGETEAYFQFSNKSGLSTIKVQGINEQYIKPVINMGIDRIVPYPGEGKIEMVLDWKISRGNGENEPTSVDFLIEEDEIIGLIFWFIVGENGHMRQVAFQGSEASNITKETIIPNMNEKLNKINQNYLQYGDECDAQEYFGNQLECNPRLLAWLFDDESLIGKSYMSLDPERYEAFQKFYKELDPWG